MAEHAATMAATVIRFPITEVVDSRDKDIDSRVVVIDPAVIPGDEADLVLMCGQQDHRRKECHFRPIRDTFIFLSVPSEITFITWETHSHQRSPLSSGGTLAKMDLHHFRVGQDRLNPTSSISPPL